VAERTGLNLAIDAKLDSVTEANGDPQLGSEKNLENGARIGSEAEARAVGLRCAAAANHSAERVQAAIVNVVKNFNLAASPSLVTGQRRDALPLYGRGEAPRIRQSRAKTHKTSLRGPGKQARTAGLVNRISTPAAKRLPNVRDLAAVRHKAESAISASESLVDRGPIVASLTGPGLSGPGLSGRRLAITADVTPAPSGEAAPSGEMASRTEITPSSKAESDPDFASRRKVTSSPRGAHSNRGRVISGRTGRLLVGLPRADRIRIGRDLRRRMRLHHRWGGLHRAVRGQPELGRAGRTSRVRAVQAPEEVSLVQAAGRSGQTGPVGLARKADRERVTPAGLATAAARSNETAPTSRRQFEMGISPAE
jgi:hypothetical protein